MPRKTTSPDGPGTGPRRCAWIASAIRRQLDDGILKPGDVVTGTFLTREHGAGRQAAFKALRLLAAGGFFKRYPGCGHAVQDAGRRLPFVPGETAAPRTLATVEWSGDD
jgi:DNA-binding GntR family transcriptional regulator